MRVILLSGSEQVGQAGMAVGADLDRASGVIQAKPGTKADVVLVLTRDDCSSGWCQDVKHRNVEESLCARRDVTELSGLPAEVLCDQAQ